MTKTQNILVADDHPILLKGLILELEERGYVNTHKASTGIEALQILIEHRPEIALLDIEMPGLNAFEVMSKASKASVKTRFIILTSHKEKAYVMKASKFNISGYILKDEPFAEVEKCIEAVLNGETYFSKLFNDIVDKEISPELKKIKFLSPSERTILKLIAKEKSSKEIGHILDVSPRTVQKHRANIINKLDLPSGKDTLGIWTQENSSLL